VTGGVLWANMHLLFWLSTIPFVTSWMGENHDAAAPVALYGAVLLACGIAYTILSLLLIRHHGKDSLLGRAFGRDVKGKFSLALYAVAIPTAFYDTGISKALYITVAILWLVPDRRIERLLTEQHDATGPHTTT
jgi:uncharacterized membrane protein